MQNLKSWRIANLSLLQIGTQLDGFVSNPKTEIEVQVNKSEKP